MRQRSGQIDRRRGFSDAAFLICTRDNRSHLFLPPPAHAGWGGRDPATGFLYMGAASRKPPSPGLTLRFQWVDWQVKNGEIAGGDCGTLLPIWTIETGPPFNATESLGFVPRFENSAASALEIQSPKIGQRILQFQAKFPPGPAFVPAPNQCGCSGNLIRQVDEAQLLSHGEALRQHRQAAFRADVDRVALRTQRSACLGPLDGHRHARIEAPRPAGIPRPLFKLHTLRKRHNRLLNNRIPALYPRLLLDPFGQKGRFDVRDAENERYLQATGHSCAGQWNFTPSTLPELPLGPEIWID